MKITKIFTLSLFVVFASCTISGDQSASEEQQAKNIVLLIGDGMGVQQVYAAMERSSEKLAMEKAEISGYSKTNSLTHKITDSAAGGTAISTGKKTANGVLAQDTTGKVFKTILEYAEEKGLSTGLISTSSITHATPASFISHEANRNNYEAIAADFLATDIEVFIGGGYDHFAEREDNLNLIDSLRSKGYEIAKTIEEVKASQADKLAGLLAEAHLPPKAEGRGEMLPEATEKALNILSKNEKGFFLMIEGSQIDWGGHANDLDYVVSETLDFDNALKVVLDFAAANPATLVVVTADHETGGLTFPSAEKGYQVDTAYFATGGHTATLVPVFSYGPGAEEFSGILDNTDFFPRFMKLYGFTEQ